MKGACIVNAYPMCRSNSFAAPSASRVATRPDLFRPPPVRPGPPGPRATWDFPSTLPLAGSAWPQPPPVGTLHGPLLLPEAPCICWPTQATGRARAPRRPPRRPSTPPVLCVQLIANLVLVAWRRRLRLAATLPQWVRPQPRLRWHSGRLWRPRTGLLARRAKVVERAWVRVAREAVGPEGQVVPQQWLAHTTAPGVQPHVVYGATTRGGALCCDATLVSPLTRTGHLQPCAVQVDGAARQVAERCKQAAYPELTRGGPQKLLVLGSEIGGRWSTGARRFVRDLVRLRAPSTWTAQG